MKKTLIATAALLLAALSAPALAQGNGFIRGEVGRSDVNLSIDGEDGSESDTTWGVRGGYWFNPNFAVEGFYSQVYSTSYDDGFDTYSAKLHGVGLGVVGKKNFGGNHQGFFIGGRAGIARGVATFDIDGDVEDAEASSAKPYFGVNAGYDFSERFGLSLNYDRMQADGDGFDVDVDTLTLGAELRF
ncbi:outer membrane beta-barrel protein [Lysobacter sp. A3-1-A15]|uniref:outer membrane beta-barrel protein n=1 Tax=Novilysobacter viscosus TaxID=3098602 RepID=UPI002ED8D2B6